MVLGITLTTHMFRKTGETNIKLLQEKRKILFKYGLTEMFPIWKGDNNPIST